MDKPKQRNLPMTEKDYKLACKNAKKYGCSFTKYMNELNRQFTLTKESLIIKK